MNHSTSVNGFPRSDAFTNFSANLKAVQSSLVQLELIHKVQIRSTGHAKDPSKLHHSVESVRRLHVLMLGILAEAHLRKTVADPCGFNSAEQKIIWSQQSQKDRWKQSIELAFRRHYNVPVHIPLDSSSIGEPQNTQLLELVDAVENQLSAVIEDRNKIAHGQWIWQLKSRKEDQFVQAPRDHAAYDYCQINAMKVMIEAIGGLVGILVVSEKTFQRDFDIRMNDFQKAVNKMTNSEYEIFCESLMRRPDPRR